jgi:Xaa-Pro aminopeptidase
MKRGWITWDQTEIPPSAFEKRLEVVRAHLAERDLPALVVYTDVWRSNQGRYFSNFMPYWNRALIVIPREGDPVLLCALSPRVYPWIKSVTILKEIRPSPNPGQQLITMCGEKGWKQVGVLDLPQLPYDLSIPNAVDVLWSAVRPTPDEAEILMYRRAAKMAREMLEAQMRDGAGLSDHEFTGRLELAFRRAGAEDLVILTTNGQSPPLPPTGATLGDFFSAIAAMEYRGHWVKVGRCLAELPEKVSESHIELLSGAYPYEFRGRADLDVGSVFALHSEFRMHSKRLFHSDSYRQSQDGAELL